jgi:hypothetical protein
VVSPAAPLRPVIARFVAAFDGPSGEVNLDFWNRVVHLESLGSGLNYYSGWINAFNAFGEQGNWIGSALKKVCSDFRVYANADRKFRM